MSNEGLFGRQILKNGTSWRSHSRRSRRSILATNSPSCNIRPIIEYRNGQSPKPRFQIPTNKTSSTSAAIPSALTHDDNARLSYSGVDSSPWTLRVKVLLCLQSHPRFVFFSMCKAVFSWHSTGKKLRAFTEILYYMNKSARVYYLQNRLENCWKSISFTLSV